MTFLNLGLKASSAPVTFKYAPSIHNTRNTRTSEVFYNLGLFRPPYRHTYILAIRDNYNWIQFLPVQLKLRARLFYKSLKATIHPMELASGVRFFAFKQVR